MGDRNRVGHSVGRDPRQGFSNPLTSRMILADKSATSADRIPFMLSGKAN
jgi:hypothetical protein